jgi:hypothetical protein
LIKGRAFAAPPGHAPSRHRRSAGRLQGAALAVNKACDDLVLLLGDDGSFLQLIWKSGVLWQNGLVVIMEAIMMMAIISDGLVFMRTTLAT